MNLLILSRYGRLGASSRVRFFQYQPLIEAAGINVTVSSMFSDDYVVDLQDNLRSPFKIFCAYSRRIFALVTQRHFDLIWIEKEAIPWAPAWLEMALLPVSVPYVLDYDDAVFHNYDLHRSLLVRDLLGKKYQRIIRGASQVVVGNDYLADYVRRSGAREVEIIPTVVDIERYTSVSSLSMKTSEYLPIVGWVGQRATAPNLASLKEIFERLLAKRLARLVAIGIDANSLGLPMESVKWNEGTEVNSISSFDVGIMPLHNEPFEQGKCGYKLIQYMACGLPVIASPVGINRKIVEHGVNGFLADTPAQWEQALLTLLADITLRKRMGAEGRRMVEKQYCLQVTGPRLVAVLKEAAKNKGNS
jgi:glycosyltransferase involved in cell wall biosynthesis